jgi:hypothetical protein
MAGEKIGEGMRNKDDGIIRKDIDEGMRRVIWCDVMWCEMRWESEW